MLKIFDHIPPGFLHTPASGLEDLLGGPSLIHLPGRRREPLFVSVLLHGNEDTGLLALQRLLEKYRDTELPRALSLFVGNVSAARLGLRRLEGQPDYNRIWPGAETSGTPEHALMAEVYGRMKRRGVFASIDLHNNTGLNPHYACVNRVDHRFFQLATLFSRTVVYFIRPKGVQSQAFAELCPAVTVECGQVGERSGVDHAAEFVDACLHLSSIPEHPVAEHDLNLFHTVATVKLVEGVEVLAGEGGGGDLTLAGDLDHLNFRELPAGTVLGRVADESRPVLCAIDEQGEDVTSRFLHCRDHQIRLSRPVMPSMLTLDTRVIRQDCLCYLMERMDVFHGGHAAAVVQS